MPQTLLNPKELIKLISDNEIEAFARLLGCHLTDSDQRKELASQLRNRSRAEVISALININGVWISMMKDVVRLLENCGVSLRTTGCVLALPINGEEIKLYLSPQIAGLIARFDISTYLPKTLSTWDAALSEFMRMERWIEAVLREGKPSRTKRLSNRKMIDNIIGRQVHHNLYESDIRMNSIAAEQMFRLWRTIDFLKAKLDSVEDSLTPPPPIEKLRGRIRRWSSDFTQLISEMRHDRQLWQKLSSSVKDTEKWSVDLKVKDLFNSDCWRNDPEWSKWVWLIEDVLAIANLDKSTEVADLLRLDLLKDRPRLFEVWCMSQILSWYQSCGCTVELHSAKSGDPPIWNLNYSRASKPVASIKHGDSCWWFFYQLFSEGADRANMPDLALLGGRDPNSNVIWIADPKYSEAGGYSRKSYLEVAERYRDAFQTEHVWICEFFTRPNWFGGLSYEHGEGFSILTGVQPNGEGARLLRRELKGVHGFAENEFILAIDCSGSFINRMPELESGIQALSMAAVAVYCFAGAAKEINDPNHLDVAVIRSVSESLVEGTLLGPLVETLSSVTARDPLHTDLILISDDQFHDSSDGSKSKLNELFANVAQAADEISLARITTERCKV
jgi:hypothetical protein